MAIQTVVAGHLPGPGGIGIRHYEYDWNDANRRITAFRGTNTTQYTYRVTFRNPKNGALLPLDFPPANPAEGFDGTTPYTVQAGWLTVDVDANGEPYNTPEFPGDVMV